MHYLYRYVCILNGFFYMCIWTIVCNKEFIIIIIIRCQLNTLPLCNHDYIHVRDTDDHIKHENAHCMQSCEPTSTIITYIGTKG